MLACRSRLLVHLILAHLYTLFEKICRYQDSLRCFWRPWPRSHLPICFKPIWSFHILNHTRGRHPTENFQWSSVSIVKVYAFSSQARGTHKSVKISRHAAVEISYASAVRGVTVSIGFSLTNEGCLLRLCIPQTKAESHMVSSDRLFVIHRSLTAHRQQSCSDLQMRAPGVLIWGQNNYLRRALRALTD